MSVFVTGAIHRSEFGNLACCQSCNTTYAACISAGTYFRSRQSHAHIRWLCQPDRCAIGIPCSRQS